MTGPAGNSTNGGAFRITSKSYIVVDGFTITGTADYGIILDTSNHITDLEQPRQVRRHDIDSQGRDLPQSHHGLRHQR